ncbi:phytochrome e [Phtheirospermum japonicum]|uniref:Phytochrome e n=1 Tax=Phtheirospermum japonicum TaxID=374723 RepID=A0A830DPD9_9LAMI|nr:phytochrome e [Phtheirospermum japonicum]
MDENPTPTPNNAGPSSSASSNPNCSETASAQCKADAQLMSEFERSGASGKPFDYAKCVPHAPQALACDDKIVAYFSKMQRGGFVQSVGCTLALQPSSSKIVAHSENCFDMLGVPHLVGPGLLGTDARNLFTPPSAKTLSRALNITNLSFPNPLCLLSKTNHRSFYGIVHRMDVCLFIDLEPTRHPNMNVVHATPIMSQALVMRAISRLHSLPRGDVGILCDKVAEEVRRLTGYDRVMVYKFHEDCHGEVLSETRRPDLEPYLGVHYPATDIPQAARFLFMQSRVRMICDSSSEPVRIIQSPEMARPLGLIDSTLRAPHACHVQYMTNMGSIASLVLAILVNDGGGGSLRLWGLVVCHHTGPRHVSFPLRCACQFLIQVFGVQLQLTQQLAAKWAEKQTLRKQMLLGDVLLHDAPQGIITQSPNIMGLVKCDGAALYYKGKSWLIGVTPDESQVKDIAGWLMQTHGDCTGMSTDCLIDAGYPGAVILGDAVCGMAMARINSADFLFWFRSHTAKEVKWGGAVNDPEGEDDVKKMHPRTSFSTFLEVVKSRSLPWEPEEIGTVHTMQLVMRNSIGEIEGNWFKGVRYLKRQDGLASKTVGVVRLLEKAAAPVFGVDSSGLINGWNHYMLELTGLDLTKAGGKSLVNDIVHEDSREVVQTLITKALQGEEETDVEVKLVKIVENVPNSFVCLRINTCMSKDCKNEVVGVCFMGQNITAEKTMMDKFIRLKEDYKSIIESVSPLIPPIFASDKDERCSEWNAVMENLTGYMRHETIGKLLVGEVFGSLCKLNGQDVITKFKILLYKAIGGHDPAGKLRFVFYDRKGELVEMYLTANKKVNERGSVIGCLCFLQKMVVGNEKDDCMDNELAYLRQEMKNPLCGIRFTHELMEGSPVSGDQKQLLEASSSCERQILSIIDNTCLGSFQVGEMELKEEEFLLGSVINAIISQTMISLREKNLRLIHDIPENIKTMCLCGDEIKLQLALSDFLVCIADYAPSPDGWVEIKVPHGLKLVKDGIEFVHLQFRMAHPGQGVPQDLIEEMFGGKSCGMRHGVALNISQKIVSKMNGNVCYIRDENESYFQVDFELKTGKNLDKNDDTGGTKALLN